MYLTTDPGLRRCCDCGRDCRTDILSPDEHASRIMRLAKLKARDATSSATDASQIVLSRAFSREDVEAELMAFAYGAGEFDNDRRRKVLPGDPCYKIRRLMEQYLGDMRQALWETDNFASGVPTTETDREFHISREIERHQAELAYLNGEIPRGGSDYPLEEAALQDWYPDPPREDLYDDPAEYLADLAEWEERQAQAVAAELERHEREMRRLRGPVPPTSEMERWIRRTFTDDGWRVEGKRRLLAAVLWAIYQDTIVSVAVEGGGRRTEVTSAEKRARDLRSLRLIFRKLRHGEALGPADRKHFQRHAVPALRRGFWLVRDGRVLKGSDARRPVARNRLDSSGEDLDYDDTASDYQHGVIPHYA